MGVSRIKHSHFVHDRILYKGCTAVSGWQNLTEWGSPGSCWLAVQGPMCSMARMGRQQLAGEMNGHSPANRYYYGEVLPA